MADEADTSGAAPGTSEESGHVVGSSAVRPVFLGNLMPTYTTEGVTRIFEDPDFIKLSEAPLKVDRVDVKRNFCFVFLKDVEEEADKKRIEDYISTINGMAVPEVSRALRVEFARGDGRIKRKEDERRKTIAPRDTLFVVNFQEDTTRREDLEMLFRPYGDLVRIEMKKNYAFVQFKTIEQATKAKDATNGGKLDQSVITVEYVAREPRFGEPARRRPRYHDRYDRRRESPPRSYYRRDSPPRYYRGRSRSRSPGRYRSRSPPRRRGSPYSRHSPGRRSPEYYRGDRGYRGDR